MNKLIAGIISVSLLVLTASNVIAKPKTKKVAPIENIPVEPQKIGGVITGKQYIVLNGGAKIIPDNSIFYISCADEKCDSFYKEVTNKFSDYAVIWNDFDKKLGDLNLKDYSCINESLKGGDLYDKCKKEVADNKKKLGTNRPMFQGQYLRETLTDLAQKSELARTDFDGNYSLNCPTVKCLVFSSGKAGSVTGYWFKIVNANSKFEMTNSSLFFDTDTWH